jgi:hypothetical protein
MDRRTIRVKEPARDQARVTKAKLGVTWSEFLDRAADELDPDGDAESLN